MKFILQILLIAIGIVSFFTYVLPEYKNVNSIKSQVAEYNQALDNAKELQIKRDEILASYNSISEVDKNRLNQLLPEISDDIETSGSISLILELDKIAAKNGIKILDIDSALSDTKIDAEDYVASNLKFSIQTNFENFISFMNDLEKNLRIMDIKSVNFSVSEASKNNLGLGIIDYHFELQSYWLKK